MYGPLGTITFEKPVSLSELEKALDRITELRYRSKTIATEPEKLGDQTAYVDNLHFKHRAGEVTFAVSYSDKGVVRNANVIGSGILRMPSFEDLEGCISELETFLSNRVTFKPPAIIRHGWLYTPYANARSVEFRDIRV